MNLDPSTAPAPPAGSSFRHDTCSDLAALPLLNDALEAWCDASDVPVATRHALLLILDELFSNVVIHGFHHSAHGRVTVQAQRRPDEVEVWITDDAPPFDPLRYTLPDVSLPIEERRVGGLGLMLVRRTADCFEYRRVDVNGATGRNEVRFTKRLPCRSQA
jgi:serine/threonine-protein kinase RsbW